ncbi:MAG: ribosome-associated translation inhibitor RaiA [Thermoanaerobaculia bacterium]
MNIEYVGRHVELNDRIRAFAEEKLGKVTKFLDEPVEARLTLERGKHGHLVDLHVAHRFGVLQGHEEAEDLFDAVHDVVEKVEKQARRERKKFLDKRRRAARPDGEAEWPVDVLDRASVGSGSRPRIVKSTAISIKPMTLDEAALQLEGSRNDFIVFRDAANQKVSVLYKRRDANYGLISPEA